MTRMTILGLAALIAAGSLVAGHVLADDKKVPTTNAEELLSKDEAYQKADLGKKIEHLKKLADEKAIDFQQKQWMQVRVLLAHAREKKIDKDLPALCKWLGETKKDHQGPIGKHGSGALDDLIAHYGTERLYKDEAFAKGDLAAKLKRVKELWEARELGQSITYSLTNDLVYRVLVPAAGDIDKELALFGELHRKNVMVWDSSAEIHRALLVRALHEKKDLDSLEKKLAFVNKATKDKEGDISWMTVGPTRVMLLVDAIDGDPEFTKLDAAGRKAKIEEWVKEGKIPPSDKTPLLAAYSTTK
jgi:hypothetical protein